ncbi:MAG: hypothetical protein Q9M13_04975, partial [Mariprofundales bacterium]|nr:hypothetical protein [Mariprofundales bacterium]
QLLWQSSPLVVVVAEDASAALWERVVMAVEKQRVQQRGTDLLRMGSMSEFGKVYDRDLVAVVAWHRDRLAGKLVALSVWRQHLSAVLCE